jgi:hypothetical protein
MIQITLTPHALRVSIPQRMKQEEASNYLKGIWRSEFANKLDFSLKPTPQVRKFAEQALTNPHIMVYR